MQQVGFVDGFFLPQDDDAATLGVEHQYNAWLAWHPSIGDVTLDYANDEMHRDAVPGHSVDAVSYQAPQAVLTLAHAFKKFVVADVGYGRYAMRGTWANTDVDYFENVAFLGAQLTDSSRGTLLVQLRHAKFAGVPSIAGGAPPNFGATTLILEQRYRY